MWLDGELLGAMQFGPPLQTSHLVGLVRDTSWNGFVELNRMALAIGKTDRLYPLESLKRPSQAGCRILSGGEKNEGSGGHAALIARLFAGAHALSVTVICRVA